MQMDQGMMDGGMKERDMDLDAKSISMEISTSANTTKANNMEMALFDGLMEVNT